MRANSQFGVLALGVTVTFFLYIFINIAMVMGLILWSAYRYHLFHTVALR